MSGVTAVALTPAEHRLALLHRRLTVGMALAGVVAFGAGVGWTTAPTLLAGSVLVLTLFWRMSPSTSTRIEHLWLPLAVLLMARAAYSIFVAGGDVVIPVVDLLLLLMTAEGLRSLDTFNDVRLYGLSFALLLAATAYRPGVTFAAAFVAYVSLASPALMLGNLRRKVRRYGGWDASAGRPLLRTAATLSGVTLLASAVVFVVFPRTSQGWAARGDAPASTLAGFSDEVTLGAWGSSILPNPAVVLRVEFPDVRPADYSALLWRGRSYDHFDGVRWSRSPRVRPSSASTTWYRQRWSGPVVAQRIYSEPMDMRVLFGLHPMIDAEPESPIHPLMDHVGDFVYWGSSAPVYTAYSLLSRPTPDELRASAGTYRPDREHYLQLPQLPPRILALADSLTRGLETRYDKVASVQRWLESELGYTTDLPATPRLATLNGFLFERREGHCEYFSTAMVMLLRAAGIEARNVTGFLGGSWSELGNYLAVTQNEAHSWVEVWFPAYGWVPFDPTPAGSGNAGESSPWMWPGRYLADALQHRWGKWVLDYSLQSQVDVIGRAARALQVERRPGDAVPGDAALLPLLIAISLLAAGTFVLSSRRRAPQGSRETRIYLQLVESCRRVGLVRGPVAPLELLENVHRFGGTAGAPASRLVSLYLRARFAGEPLGEAERAEMTDALRRARRALSERRRELGALPARAGTG
jgi:transglutaminase-like putative cysteine protease